MDGLIGLEIGLDERKKHSNEQRMATVLVTIKAAVGVWASPNSRTMLTKHVR